MMFYNGFNLMIDMFIGGAVYYFASRISDRKYLEIANDFWEVGQDETLAAIDAGHIFKTECDGALVWSMTEEYVNA